MAVSRHFGLATNGLPSPMIHELAMELWHPRPVEEVFAFYTNVAHLHRVMPSWLKLIVLSEQPIELNTGRKIDYRITLHGVPFRWRTCITGWQPPRRMTEVQCRGPYRSWTLDQVFDPHDGGTRVRSRLRYEVPGGRIVDAVLVGPILRRLFRHRNGHLTRLLDRAVTRMG